ncbi:MAG: LptE family protein [Planctomycetales bacterium]
MRLEPGQQLICRRTALGLLLAGGTSALTGCGYVVGHGFDPQLRTVCVPIFKNDTNRRNIEYMLTEAVQKQIQTRTSYKLVKDPEADTRLVGRIVDIRKNVLGETQFDDPRELQLTLAAKVKWEDLRSQKVLMERTYDMPQDAVQFLARGDFAPEVGQSLATAQQTAVDKMARDIVNMMEVPW